MTDHDQISKRLVTEFPFEFLQLFFPDLCAKLDESLAEFKDKEIYADSRFPHSARGDVLLKARVHGAESFVLILVEPQSEQKDEFPLRLLHYTAGLQLRYDLPVFPIALLTYDEPKILHPNTLTLTVLGNRTVLFEYNVVQLNSLHWSKFRGVRNPILAALLVKMQMDDVERVEVEYESLRIMTSFELSWKQKEALADFRNAYLNLSDAEKEAVKVLIRRAGKTEQEAIMNMTSHWKREGLEEGRKEEAVAFVLRQLTKRLGVLGDDETAQIRLLGLDKLEQLGDDLLDFSNRDDLVNWLAKK